MHYLPHDHTHDHDHGGRCAAGDASRREHDARKDESRTQAQAAHDRRAGGAPHDRGDGVGDGRPRIEREANPLAGLALPICYWIAGSPQMRRVTQTATMPFLMAKWISSALPCSLSESII